MTTTKAETEQALRAILERNHTVYAVVHHVSRSRMQRRIDFYVIEMRSPTGYPLSEPEPTLRRISHLISKVRGSRLTDDGVVVNKGQGWMMDAAWDTIYECRYTLGLGDVRYVDSAVGEQFKLGYGFDIRYL